MHSYYIEQIAKVYQGSLQIHLNSKMTLHYATLTANEDPIRELRTVVIEIKTKN